jgi:hypothetical protein
MMGEMTGRAGPCGSSIGHVSAMATSQDTTVALADLDGEELPATRRFSQVHGDMNGCTVLNDTQGSSQDLKSFQLEEHLQITDINPLFSQAGTESQIF